MLSFAGAVPCTNKRAERVFAKPRRSMAAAAALCAMPGGKALQRLVSVAEGLLEVLARPLLLQPAALPTLLLADAEVHARFLDSWLAVALTRCRCLGGHRMRPLDTAAGVLGERLPPMQVH